MTIGLAVIVRNEQRLLPGLLDSAAGAFDQVVLVDTGSSDATCAVFERWAETERGRNREFSATIAAFAWTDDFAAARNHADSLLTTDWNVWADADDEISGARNLRHIATSAPAEIVAFVAGYRYAQNGTGQAISYVKRHRLVRAGSAIWRGRLHETLTVRGPTLEIPPNEVEWVHRRDLGDGAAASATRNMALLEAWSRDEPGNHHVMRLLGDAYSAVGDSAQALDCYERYIAVDPEWGPLRARVYWQRATCLMALGRHEEALACGQEAADAVPDWPESYLTLAEAHLQLGDPQAAIENARTALRLGPPDTELVVKPLEYSVKPRMVIARALRMAGQLEQSVLAAQELLAECFAGS